VIDEGIVDRDDAVGGVAGAGSALQAGQAPLVEALGIPVHLGDPSIEAGLVGGDGELAVDATHVLVLGDEQAGQVLGKVLAGRFSGEEVALLGQGLLHEGGKLDNSRHRTLPTDWAKQRAQRGQMLPSAQPCLKIAKHQF
jgi:hypothetical protein